MTDDETSLSARAGHDRLRRWRAALALLLLLVTPVAAVATTLQERVEAVLASAGPGVRFGFVVADTDGRELVAIDPDGRFIPASNTKMVTTAAAFATLHDHSAPDEASGAAVRLERNGRGAPDVVLVGHGDARLSAAPDCVTNCLAALADAVARDTRTVHDVVGDDSFFPDQRWSAGMSWNNIPTRSGTGISALTLDDNETLLTVTPGATGQPPTVSHAGYYRIENRAVTGGATNLDFDRLPFEQVVRLSGTVAPDVAPQRLRLGIDDPARYAAWMLRRMLLDRGVRVTGEVSVRHRPPRPFDDPAVRGAVPTMMPAEPPALARLTVPPLDEDIAIINKLSQNLHAELLLRRIGRVSGTGSVADGIAAVHRMMARAGVPRTAYDLSDGSGMSTYNRLSPRGVVTLMRWIGVQPWSVAWRATLPSTGEGTLARRFRGSALEGRLTAKTGTLNATHALSGYLVAKSGRTLLFSTFANDVPAGVDATDIVDRALAVVAEEG